MRPEERAALEASAELNRRFLAVSRLMRGALLTARDAGLAAGELADAWSIDTKAIRLMTDTLRKQAR